jgi:sugar fermentation stimulation protein A
LCYGVIGILREFMADARDWAAFSLPCASAKIVKISSIFDLTMRFSKPLIAASLLRRYKRFLADVSLANGELVTVHTANTGSMLGCAEPGSRVWLSRSAVTTRKYPYSWEITETAEGVLVGINTALANALVKEAIEGGVITELQGYSALRGEVAFGKEGSCVDLYLEGKDRAACYVEVKNVTAASEGVAIFPDAVSVRGTKHLRELTEMVAQGCRAVLCFCVQRGDVTAVRPADEIDPVYGETLRAAVRCGVEVIAYQAEVTQSAIDLRNALPVVL